MQDPSAPHFGVERGAYEQQQSQYGSSSAAVSKASFAAPSYGATSSTAVTGPQYASYGGPTQPSTTVANSPQNLPSVAYTTGAAGSSSGYASGGMYSTSASPTGYGQQTTYSQTTTAQQLPITTTTTTTTQEYSVPAGYETTGGAASHYTSTQQAGSQQQQQLGSASVSRYMSGAAAGYSTTTSQYNRMPSGATETSRIVGHEYGPERVISVQQHVDNSRSHIVSEQYIEHEIKVPKKIIREEIVENVIIRPEKVIREEIIEETAKVREKIVEVAKPRIEEKIIERPEYEIWEKIIEVPEIIRREKIREEVQVQYQDRVVEVPVVKTQERVVEIPEIVYQQVPVERIVEVPEIREEVIVRQVPVPQYVDKPVPQYVEVEIVNNIDRNIPVPVEAIVAYEFRIPKLKGHYTKVTYPVYLPRFVETPIAAELYNATITSKAENYLQQISSLTRTAASLCEIENLAASIMQADLMTQCQQVDVQAAMMQAWQSGVISLGGVGAGAVTTTATTATYKHRHNLM
eukprot:Gregarina_sp_Poly_1__4137@NODE_2265_length_2381_cov_945_496975_g227_i1_p1_GENE_NODE_2265_length_2381_cov_945_496975_g227_i1NODE_2265_length_2381_cov_945_496975_g227_i1_p1_ORF_typecomplete_len519_score67_11IMCp/PF12314_8/1_8e04IMCp/PF12314_8/2_5e07IMCp/PF12314_8/0_37_NODE_2265_length_2381_cov_945_496975_g227_i16802236